MSIRFSQEQLDAVFPFHIALDRNLRITEVGPALQRLLGSPAPGRLFAELFQVERPQAASRFDSLVRHASEMFIIAGSNRANGGAFRLRGQLLHLPPAAEGEPESLLFLVSPWITSAAGMRELGLTLNDFPHHDPVVDFLQVVQSQVTAVSELRQLNSKLNEQREALRHALAVLHATLESTADGILVADLTGRIASHNRRFLELWRLPADTVIPAAPGLLREMVRNQVADPEAFDERIRWLYRHPAEEIHDLIRLNDGRVFDRYSRPHRLGEEIIGRVWSYRDITETSRAEEALRISEERYRIVAETASDGIITIDETSRILFANKAALTIFGYTAEELTRMTLLDLMPAELRARHTAALTRYHESGTRSMNWLSVSVPGLRKDGTQIPLELSFGESTIAGARWYTGIVRDVTETRRTARALAASERRYRSVVDHLNEVIFQTDRRGCWTFLSPAWTTITGYPVALSLGRYSGDYIHPEDRARNAELFRELLGGEREFCRHHVRYASSSGELRHLEVFARLTLDDDGAILGTSGSLSDVTERLGFEASLQRARDAAETANRAKTDFLANMSHEIRTPLNAIIGMSELMNSTALGPEQRAYQETIWTSAESLLNLINDLLDVSKIESGQIDVDSTDFDPGEICEEAVRMLKSRVQQKGIRLYCYSFPALPPRVSGDPNRLRQVLVNLLGNALKFTDEGHIALVLGWSILQGERVSLQFEVSDTGCGIEPADREKIFEKFVQLDTSISRRFSGAGLGLNISRALAEAMGGALNVESEPGKGSSFRLNVTLPRAGSRPVEDFVLLDRCRGLSVLALSDRRETVHFVRQLEAWGASVKTAAAPDDSIALTVAEGEADEPPVNVPLIRDPLLPREIRDALALCVKLPPSIATAPAAVPRPARKSSATPVILLVEDNVDNRKLALRVLEEAGYVVEVATNGVEAVSAARRFTFSLILMDLRMPQMDGFAATRAIREQEAADARPRVPIIALTAHALEEHREQAFAEGMDDYVTKPFRRDHLLSVIERWLDARPQILLVDDAPEIHRLIEGLLRSAGDYRLVGVATAADALRAFATHNFSLVLLDLELGESNGLDVARALSAVPGKAAAPMVAMTGHAGRSVRERCLAAGCAEYLEKPIRRSTLIRCIEKYLPPAFEAVSVSADLADLIPDYLASLREDVDGMKQRLLAGDMGGVLPIAHRIKGSGGGYGFDRITALAKAVEGAAANGEPKLTAETVRALDVYLAGLHWQVEDAGSDSGG